MTRPPLPLLRIIAMLWLALIALAVGAQVPDFRQVFDKHGVVMLLIDPASGEIVDANPAAADFYGHHRDVLKAMTIQQINTFSAEQVAAERALAEKENRNYFIFRHRLANHEIRTVEVYSHPFDVGNRRLLLSMIQDITPGRNREQGMWHYQQRLEELVAAQTAEAEARRRTVLVLLGGLLITSGLILALAVATRRRKHVELQLHDSEALYRNLFESSPHPMWVYDLETLRFLAVNDGAITHYGYSRDEFLAMTIKDIRPSGDLPRLYRNLEQLPETGVDHAGIWQHVKKDGGVIEVEITSHLLEFEGRKAEMVLAHDVTESRRAEQQLRASEARLRQAQRIARIGNWEFDVATHALTWSDEVYRIFGFEPQAFEATYEAFLDGIHPDDRKRFSQAYADSLNARTPYTIEHRLLMKDGSVKFVHERCETLYDENGQPLRSIGTVQDITERKLGEFALALAARRDQALLNLPAAAENLDEAAFMQHGLDVAEALTGSRIGFIHFVNDDQVSIELVTWSRATLEHFCRATCDKRHPVSQAGIWANALRRRAPVVFNDYAGTPDKHGLPEGHAHLERLISVPVIESGRVRMMTGVGNKPEPYTDADVETVRLLGEAIWRIVSKKHQQAELQQQFAELSQWHEVMLGREGRVLELKREADALRRRLGDAPHYAEELAEAAPEFRQVGGSSS